MSGCATARYAGAGCPQSPREGRELRILTPLAEMSLYEWNTKVAKDYFCPVCGILPFRRPRNAPDLWTVNARCLEGVTSIRFPSSAFSGAS
jgi:hypothetical protein